MARFTKQVVELGRDSPLDYSKHIRETPSTLGCSEPSQAAHMGGHHGRDELAAGKGFK